MSETNEQIQVQGVDSKIDSLLRKQKQLNGMMATLEKARTRIIEKLDSVTVELELLGIDV